MIIKQVENERPSPLAPVTVKKCGNIVEIRHSVHGPPKITIEKLTADLYMDKLTGEIKEFQRHANRLEDKQSISQSLKKLRDLINCNLENSTCSLWVTLTYKDNIKDCKQLYKDYHAFWKRFRRYLQKQHHPPAEYIIAAEPQGRGAWHLHCLFLFPGKAPFIPNVDMARIWGHGFTKTQSLKGVGNPGLYLAAYLGDMDVSQAASTGQFRAGRLAASKDKSKAVIKGGRLKLYPPGFNLYRCSRGIKRPEVWQTTEQEAQEEVSEMPLTFEKTLCISDGSGTVKNIVNYRTFTKMATAEDSNGSNVKDGQNIKEELS